MYVCISGRFESMQSILEVSHWASYFWQTAMCLIGRSVARTYMTFHKLCVSANGKFSSERLDDLLCHDLIYLGLAYWTDLTLHVANA